MHVSPWHLAGAKALLDKIIRGHHVNHVNHVDGEARAWFMPSVWAESIEPQGSKHVSFYGFFFPAHAFESVCFCTCPPVVFFALRKPAICLFTCHPIVESACLSISRSVCKSVMSVCLPIYPSILLNFAPPCVLPFSIRHSTQPHAPVHLFICLSSPLMTPLH